MQELSITDCIFSIVGFMSETSRINVIHFGGEKFGVWTHGVHLPWKIPLCWWAWRLWAPHMERIANGNLVRGSEMARQVVPVKSREVKTSDI